MAQTLFCPIHPKELVIRVSLKHDDKKLFYCFKCFENNSNVSSLTSFLDVIPALHAEYSSLQKHTIDRKLLTQVSSLSTNEKAMERKLTAQVGKNQKKINIEIDSLETETLQMLRDVRAKTQERLDQYAATFKDSANVYSTEIQKYEEVIIDGNKRAQLTQEDINNMLFDTNDTAKAEENLSQMLEEISFIEEIKRDPKLDKIKILKKKLQDVISNNLIVPEKSQADYGVYFDRLKNYMEAVIFEQDEATVIEETKDKNGDQEKDLIRQKELSKDLFKELESLNNKIKKSAKEIDTLLQEKYTLTIKKEAIKCSVTENGMKKILGKAYKCATCIAKQPNYLDDTDLICEECFQSCHKDHNKVYVDTKAFICQCQFTMGLECNLSVDCTFKYSGTSHVNQAYYRCRTDNMGHSKCLCGFCVKNCHKGHEYIFYSIGTAYCDCPSMYSFCKHKK